MQACILFGCNKLMKILYKIKMIQISNENIEYTGDEKMQQFNVINKGQIPILYKVKTNNVGAIDARPNLGSIAPHSTVNIHVRRNAHVADNVKLQFSYTQCNEPLVDGQFKDLWIKNQTNQKSKILPVRIIKKANEDKQQKMKSQRGDSGKTQSPVNSGIFQSVVSSNQDYEQQKKQSQKKQAIYENIIIIEKKTEQKKSQNKYISSKINQKQKQETKVFENRLFKEPRNIATTCKKIHFKIAYFILIALVFFIVGFYFGHSRTSNTGVQNQIPL